MESIKNLEPKGKKILVRLDLNVEIDKEGNIFDLFRIKKAIPTISYLIERGALKVIIISHLGRPDPTTSWLKKDFSLKPLIPIISKLIGCEVVFIEKNLEKELEQIKAEIEFSSNQIFLLENIRYYEAEIQNDEVFAQKLASLADIYINEAFSASHREAASLCAIKKFLPAYRGLLLEEEINHLNQLLINPSRPLVALMGGAKISDKLPLLIKMLDWTDKILIGGALANTLLKAKGYEIGLSLAEDVSIVPDALLNHPKLIIPQDVMVLEKEDLIKDKKINEVLATDNILDIGQETLNQYLQAISSAQMLFWNGPMGKIEDERFRKSSIEILNSLLDSKAFIVIGGGETCAILNWAKADVFSCKNIFISTGGGALLSYLAQKDLVALKD